jgi:aspartyl-tRNA(Asn)/glutamyl-tRNA(Gln) amidotransferase subunit B
LVRAIEYETERQTRLLESGDKVVQETRHWDEEGGRTIAGRSKEEAHDYRYFPEPDLVPVAPTVDMRERVRTTMPELPAARRARLVSEWGIKEEDARALVDSPPLAEYTEKAVAALQKGTPKDVVNWVRQDVLAYLNETGLSPAVLSGEMLAELVALVADGTISRNQGKDVLAESLRDEKWPRDIVEEQGLAQVSDEAALAATVDSVLAANANVVEEYRAASDDKSRQKKRGFLMGKLQAELKGKGNPQVLSRLLDDRLA